MTINLDYHSGIVRAAMNSALQTASWLVGASLGSHDCLQGGESSPGGLAAGVVCVFLPVYLILLDVSHPV